MEKESGILPGQRWLFVSDNKQLSFIVEVIQHIKKCITKGVVIYMIKGNSYQSGQIMDFWSISFEKGFDHYWTLLKN